MGNGDGSSPVFITSIHHQYSSPVFITSYHHLLRAMRVEKHQEIIAPFAWKGADLQHRTDWIRPFTPAELAEIDAAVRQVKRRGLGWLDVTREDFPIPAFAREFAGIAQELETGRGIILLRGLPMEYSADDLRLAYWGMGAHLGTAVSQGGRGELLGAVEDEGRNLGITLRRGAKTAAELPFHADRCDIVGLLCVRRAKSGGYSRVVSATAIHNEILRRRPDLVATLYQPFPFDRNGEEGPGQPPYFELPLCRYETGRLRMFYIGWYIRDSQRHPQAPRLTPAQREVIDLIDEIAADPAIHLDMDFRAGDIQWLKNAVILHARTEFEDHDAPERKRHLLRLWLTSRRAFSDGDALLRQGIPRQQGSVSDAVSAQAAVAPVSTSS
jgi:hypothetical protein